MRKPQTGTSLLEMMIALFVLAVGLLGVVSMQIKAMQFNQTAYYYSQAVYLANNILENIRSNPSMRDAYQLEFDDTPSASVDCGTASGCTPRQMRDWNIVEFRRMVDELLVGGRAAIATNGDFITVTLQFDDSRSAMPGEDAEPAEYVLTTEI